MTSGAAIGYMILAAYRLGIAHDEIERLETAMFVEMDNVSEEEAEQVYKDF